MRHLAEEIGKSCLLYICIYPNLFHNFTALCNTDRRCLVLPFVHPLGTDFKGTIYLLT